MIEAELTARIGAERARPDENGAAQRAPAQVAVDPGQ